MKSIEVELAETTGYDDLVPEVPTTRAGVSAICRDFVAFELIGGSNNSPDRHEPRK